jgi:hypothetical protein
MSATVEEIFREAQPGYVSFRHEGVYTLVSPGLEEDMQFLGRELTMRDASEKHVRG